MKCKHCNKEIKGEVSYYQKDPVHPACYENFKYKKKHPTPKPMPVWLNQVNLLKTKK